MDLYQTCPCGSGKKTKFCCKALASDLDRIKKMMDGNQRQAAVDLIDRLLVQRKEKTCLYAMKMTILLNAEDIAATAPVVQAFLEHAPDNAIALAGAAVIAAASADISDDEQESEELLFAESAMCRTAVDRLQQALDACGEILPVQVFHAISLVAERLMQEGMLVAAKEHLVFQASLSAKEDTRAASGLARFYKSSAVSLMVKQPLVLPLPAANAPWRNEYRTIVQLCQRGQWRRSLKLLDGLNKRYPDEPSLIRSGAILYARLGENVQAAKWLRTLADLEADDDSAIAAEALAQLLEPDSYQTYCDVVLMRIPIDDAAATMERLLSDRRLVSVHSDPTEMKSDGEPPPRGVFWLLDGAMPDTDAEITIDTLPLRMGNMFVYGKETDREARVELASNRDDRFGDVLSLVEELLGEEKLSRAEEEVIDQVPLLIANMRAVPNFPAELPPAERIRLSREHSRKVLLERWPVVQRDDLDGKSVEEISHDPKYHRWIHAAILNLEAADQHTLDAADFATLRRQLGLPDTAEFSPKPGQIGHLPLTSLSQINASQLTDGDLFVAFRRATLVSASRAICQFGEEILRRENFDGKVDKAEVHGILAPNQKSISASIDHLVAAQQAAKDQGQSPAVFLIRELQAQFINGDAERGKELLGQIQNKYIREPGIGEMLFDLLESHGLIQPDGTPTSSSAPTDQGEQPVEVGAASEVQSEGLWVPGESKPPVSEENQVASKLWVPGMD